MSTSRDELIEILKEHGIIDLKVLKAMIEVDRSLFVPIDLIDFAFDDRPLPIGYDQVISQPYLVAYMAQELKLNTNDIVFEVGTGSGYHAAVLSKLVSHVYSFEIIEPLAKWGMMNLESAGIKNVTTKIGDGYEGLPEKAPFDAIIFTAAPPVIPEPLKKQLKIGGRMILPIGDFYQHLELLLKTGENNFEMKRLISVRFVPMTGKAQSI